MRGGWGRGLILLTALAAVAAACGDGESASVALPDNVVPAASTASSTSPTTEPRPEPLPATTTTTTTPPRLVPATTTSIPTTTVPPGPTTTVEPLPDPGLPSTIRAFGRLIGANPAVSMTIVRDGVPVFSFASGTTVAGDPTTPDSPMVVASVSKLVVAVAIARLEQQGELDVSAPVPWADLGLTPDSAWADVTIRELLDHRAGMPVARTSWFTGEGSCAQRLPTLVAQAPQGHRGEWKYSNGNYCALGLVVEQRTGRPLDDAVQQLVFDPIDADGVHLTTDGIEPGDVAYSLGIARLSRLGGAGSLIVSTDDLATMLATLGPADLATLNHPGVFTDQYGWGHTGTIDGAKSCAWVLEAGRTVVVATIAGDSVGTGGGVCDIVIPAIASDLGIAAGKPDRTPP